MRWRCRRRLEREQRRQIGPEHLGEPDECVSANWLLALFHEHERRTGQSDSIGQRRLCRPAAQAADVTPECPIELGLGIIHVADPSRSHATVWAFPTCQKDRHYIVTQQPTTSRRVVTVPVLMKL